MDLNNGSVEFDTNRLKHSLAVGKKMIEIGKTYKMDEKQLH